MDWMIDADQALRQVVVDLEQRTDDSGWDQPPVLIDVRMNMDGDVLNVETDPIAFGEHPIDMLKTHFDAGWRPMGILLFAEGFRTMQADEAMVVPEWESLPQTVKEHWRHVMLQFPPSQMHPFVVEVRTVLYVDAEREWMLIRDRDKQPEWVEGEDDGEIVKVARRVVAGLEPLV